MKEVIKHTTLAYEYINEDCSIVSYICIHHNKLYLIKKNSNIKICAGYIKVNA